MRKIVFRAWNSRTGHMEEIGSIREDQLPPLPALGDNRVKIQKATWPWKEIFSWLVIGGIAAVLLRLIIYFGIEK